MTVLRSGGTGEEEQVATIREQTGQGTNPDMEDTTGREH